MSQRRYGGENGYGHVADPFGHQVTSVRKMLAGANTLPRRASLAAFRAPIQNQGRTSSCVGFATASAIFATMGAKGTPIALPSAMGIYAVARCIDRHPEGGLLPALEDVGCMPNQVGRALAEWGVPSADVWPFDASKINFEPTLRQLEAASAFRLDGTYGLDWSDPAFDALLQASIAGGYAVTFAIDVDRAFEDYDGRGVIGAQTGASLGGHELFVDEYETDANGDTTYTIPNSWGTSYGDGGLVRVNGAFLRRMRDVRVMRVSAIGDDQ